MTSWQLPTQQASLFGKLPTVLDYVRINHSYPPAIALDEWMSRALQDLTVASLSWPAARYRFVFSPSGGEHAVVGVFSPSKDRAGRKFPISVFAPVPVRALAGKFAAIPNAAQAFFEAAEALLDEAAKLSRDDAAERLLGLPRLDPDAFEQQHSALQVALDERSTEAFVRDVYAADEYQAEEAFARASAALAKLRNGPPERALALDCPISSSDDVCAWLSLAEVCLSWGQELPSLFWTTSPEPGRLLMSLGTPLPALPLWLADRKRKSDRLVSLHPTGTPSQASYASSSAPPAASSAPPAAAYAPPATGSAYAPPATGSAYAPPATGSAYAAPATGSAPAPSAPAPTPMRRPQQGVGSGTPPQGFAIAMPADAHGFAPPGSTAAPQPALTHDPSEPASDGDLASTPSHAADDGAVELPAAPAVDEPGTAYVAVVTSAPATPPTAERGPSLWRKLRAVAASA